MKNKRYLPIFPRIRTRLSARTSSKFLAQPQRMLVIEPEPATTMPVSSAKFVNENRELAGELWQAHRELTD